MEIDTGGLPREEPVIAGNTVSLVIVAGAGGIHAIAGGVPEHVGVGEALLAVGAPGIDLAAGLVQVAQFIEFVEMEPATAEDALGLVCGVPDLTVGGLGHAAPALKNVSIKAVGVSALDAAAIHVVVRAEGILVGTHEGAAADNGVDSEGRAAETDPRAGVVLGAVGGVLDRHIVQIEGVADEGLGADALRVYPDAGVPVALVGPGVESEALLAGSAGEVWGRVIDAVAVHVLVVAVVLVENEAARLRAHRQVDREVAVAVPVLVQQVLLVAAVAVVLACRQHIAVHVFQAHGHQTDPRNRHRRLHA